MTVLLATNNLHKKGELEKLFPDFRLLLPRDVGLDGWDHDETADTFQGNALGKARALWVASGRRHPVLADDSGICVDALGGAPGIYSARFGTTEAGRALSDTEKNALLLSKLNGVTDRGARFVCALVLVVGSHREYVIEEAWEGVVGLAPSGAAGFGYDPIFFLPELGCSSADLSPDHKNQISHRARASRRMRLILKDLQEHP